jgi:hypothetical protein
VSSYQLPEGFPYELSADELDDAVERIADSIRERYGGVPVADWLPELQIALVTLAISDQSRRQLVSGSRVAIASLFVAGAALAVAILTIVFG